MEDIDINLITKWLKSEFSDLQAAYLFGSFASGQQRPSSDVDIAILIPRKIPAYDLWNKAQELAILLNRDVDLVNLISANTVFQNEIIQHGKLIFVGDDVKRFNFECYVIRSYLDFMPARNTIIEHMKKGNQNG